MSIDAARAVADAVLYQDCGLYPDRAPARISRSRWPFGVVVPEAFAGAHAGESALSQCECLLDYDTDAAISVLVRFLHIQRRTAPGSAPSDEPVKREFAIHSSVNRLLRRGRSVALAIDGGDDTEETDHGPVVRHRAALRAEAALSVHRIDGPWRTVRLRIAVYNRTTLPTAPTTRDDAIIGSLVAVHIIAAAAGGGFVSMVDPPRWAVTAVADCRNIGCWPVLAGPASSRDTILALPIMLRDHPEIAPESPGPLYGAAEVHDLLTLRPTVLTGDERRAVRVTDPTAAPVGRVDSLDPAGLERR
jgi:hypothetical protein